MERGDPPFTTPVPLPPQPHPADVPPSVVVATRPQRLPLPPTLPTPPPAPRGRAEAKLASTVVPVKEWGAQHVESGEIKQPRMAGSRWALVAAVAVLLVGAAAWGVAGRSSGPDVADTREPATAEPPTEAAQATQDETRTPERVVVQRPPARKSSSADPVAAVSPTAPPESGNESVAKDDPTPAGDTFPLRGGGTIDRTLRPTRTGKEAETAARLAGCRLPTMEEAMEHPVGKEWTSTCLEYESDEFSKCAQYRVVGEEAPYALSYPFGDRVGFRMACRK